MKKSPSLIIAILSFGLALPFGIDSINKTSILPLNAEEQITQKYAYDQMVILSSSISGGDITNDNSDPNALIDYGFRHGNVETGNIQEFSIFGEKRLGDTNVNGAAFLNWRMLTGNGDGAIIKFTANEKIFFSISRENLGYDWRNETTISIYKNSTLLSEKEINDNTTTADDFSFSCVLEEGETLYWQALSYATDNPRHISMGAAGDYTTLPVITVSQYVEYDSTEISLGNLVTHYLNNNGETIPFNSIFSYSFINGSIGEKTPLNKGNDNVNHSNSLIKTNGEISLGANEGIGLNFIFNSSAQLNFSWLDKLSSFENISINYYIKNSIGTKLALDLKTIDENNFELLSKNFIVSSNEIVTIILNNTSSSAITNVELLETISITEVPTNTSIKSDYPMYEANDYSSATTITHKQLAFETAKLQCSPIVLKDINISLLTGTVTETNGENLKKFDTITYDNGIYLEKQISPSLTLAGPNGTFNTDDQAVVEDYRLQTSISEGVVYKITATKDTKLVITHPKANGGWVGDGVFFEALQNNNKAIKSFYKEMVNDANAPENTFSVTYHLENGDSAYYVFGSDMALRRNLNIAPIFTTYENEFDSLKREEIFGATVAEATLYQTVTDTINNNYQPVTYEDVFTVGLYHGTVEEKELFKTHKGTGNGGADDALITGSGVDSDAGFQRWQFHAGLNNDNAIMMFTVNRAAKLTISHKAMGDLFYNAGASLKYYILDVDNFAEYKEERYLSNDTPADFYGYQVHLKEKQSLLIEFTANDPEGYAVASIEWTATANPKEFDETLINDFSDARDLQSYKDTLVAQLESYVSALYPQDYTINNFSKIESFVDEFKASIKKMDVRSEIQQLYEETIAKIDAVLTIDEEAEKLQNAKNAAIKDAEEYIYSKKDSFTKSEWENVLDEYDSFVLAVNFSTSETTINVLLIEFKATIDSMPATQALVKQQQTTALIISLIAGGCLLVAVPSVVVPLVIKNKKRK